LYYGTNLVGMTNGRPNGPMCYFIADPQVPPSPGSSFRSTDHFGNSTSYFGLRASLLSGGSYAPVDHIIISNSAATGPITKTSLVMRMSQVPAMVITNEVAMPLTLNSTKTGNSLELQWLGTGVLQSSPDLRTWSDIINSTSPYFLPIGESNRFYRIRQPLGDETGF
jgi:hypothetical protein